MRTIDFSPLYRSVVGFDRLANLLETAAADSAAGYPPYNIERTDENAYRIDIAVAGFRPEELNVEVKAWRDIWSAGQVVDAAHALPSVGDLVRRLAAEYDEAGA